MVELIDDDIFEATFVEAVSSVTVWLQVHVPHHLTWWPPLCFRPWEMRMDTLCW